MYGKCENNLDRSRIIYDRYSIISTLTSYWYQKKKNLTPKKVVKIGGLLPAEFAVAFLKLVIRKRPNQLTTVPELNVLLRNLGIYLDL